MPVDVGFTDTEILPNALESVRQPDPSMPITLDPDTDLWQRVVLSIWPFTGSPTTGTWPKGWVGVDNTSSLYVCTAGGTPGTWQLISSGGGSSGGTIPGMVADGVTDNFNALTTYVNAFVAANPGGGITPQKVPLGRCAISQTFVPPTGVILDGYGNAVMGGTFNANASGSWLCPTASFTGSQIVRLDNQWSGTKNLNIDAGTTVFSAIQVNAADCRFDSCSALRGAASLNGITFDSTTNAQRLAITGGWDIRVFVTDSTVTALNALGGDWEVHPGRVTHGGKLINVLGGVWSGVHFTHSSASGATAALHNVNDLGGSIYIGCYFDSCSGDAISLVGRGGTNTSCFFGCRFYQNTAGVTGIPVIDSSPVGGGAGTIVVGGWIKVGGATGSSFSTAFQPSVTPTAQYDIFTGAMTEQPFTVSFFAPGATGTPLPGAAYSNNNNGAIEQNTPLTQTSTPTFTTNNYDLQPNDLGATLQASNGATPGTVTIRNQTTGSPTLPVPIGSQVAVTQIGTGKISFAAGTGVTLQSPGGLVGCRVQFSTITATKVGANTWVLSDDLG